MSTRALKAAKAAVDETLCDWGRTSIYRGDWRRRTTWILAMGEKDYSVWYKYEMQPGMQRVDLLDIDGYAWIVPDGGCNYDPLPIHPPTTWDEAVRRLSNIAIAPSLVLVRVDGQWHLSFAIWPVPPDGPWSYEP